MQSRSLFCHSSIRRRLIISHLLKDVSAKTRLKYGQTNREDGQYGEGGLSPVHDSVRLWILDGKNDGDEKADRRNKVADCGRADKVWLFAVDADHSRDGNDQHDEARQTQGDVGWNSSDKSVVDFVVYNLLKNGKRIFEINPSLQHKCKQGEVQCNLCHVRVGRGSDVGDQSDAATQNPTDLRGWADQRTNRLTDQIVTYRGAYHTKRETTRQHHQKAQENTST